MSDDKKNADKPAKDKQEQKKQAHQKQSDKQTGNASSSDKKSVKHTPEAASQKIDKSDSATDKNNKNTEVFSGAPSRSTEQVEKTKDSVSQSKTTKPMFSAKPAPKLKTAKRKRKKNLLPIIAILLAVIAITALVWTSYHQYQINQDWQAMQNSVASQLESQSQSNQASQQAASSGLETARNNLTIINQQRQLIQQLTESLTSTQERIRELSGRRQQDWMLAEAEYLINLADFKITIEKDKQSAIALLKTADEKVAQIGDNRLSTLRQTIAQDISNLQLIITPDLTGTFVKIDAIINQIPQLEIIWLELNPIQERVENLSQEKDESFEWGKIFRDFIDDFVSIKDHSEVEPLMTPEQHGNLNANVQLALQQAQIALFQGDQKLYQISLGKAANWIQEYFKDDPKTHVLLEEIETLKQIQVNMDSPSQLLTKQEIININQDRLYQWLDTSSTKSSLQNSQLENEQ